MPKQHLMKYIFFLLAVAGLLASCQQRAGDGEDRETTSTDRQRPNVLYIMADDLTTQAIGAYGSIYRDVAPTPNMDRLAAAGMLFEDVLCTNAICGPSRAAINRPIMRASAIRPPCLNDRISFREASL